MLNDEIRTRMREILVIDIKGGAFVREWSQEQATGSATLDRLHSLRPALPGRIRTHNPQTGTEGSSAGPRRVRLSARRHRL